MDFESWGSDLIRPKLDLDSTKTPESVTLALALANYNVQVNILFIYQMCNLFQSVNYTLTKGFRSLLKAKGEVKYIYLFVNSPLNSKEIYYKEICDHKHVQASTM